MIDTLYQAEINKNLDDQLQRPGAVPPPAPPGAFTGWWRGLGGLPGGVSSGFGTAADVLEGTAKVDAAQGLVWNPGTRSYTQLPMDESSRALQATIKAGHIADLFTSDTGDTFRTVAKDYMPDPQTTGVAAQILGQGLHFMGQAVPTMAAGGPVLGPAGVAAFSGMQEADRLREQGVDQATREKAGLVVGAGSAGAMLLPMSGPTAWARFGKGAVGGAVSSAAQTEVEKLVLEHAGYDKLAAQYDPFDPVNLSISALVPGVLGAAMGHAAAAREVPMPDGVTADTSAAAANLRMDNDIAAVQRELARKETTSEQRTILQGELDKLNAEKQGSVTRAAIANDPDLEAAARVKQTSDAMDSSRLSAEDDLAGREAHQQALETASDQIGRGDPVAVDDIVSPSVLDERGFPRDYVDTRGGDDRFHGTSRPIDSLSDDYAMNGDSRNIYGQGFYTTDAADVAGGYMRKGRGGKPTLYSVKTAEGVKLKNMDEAMAPETVAMLRNSMGDAFPEENHITGKPIKTMREAFDEFRVESRDHGLTRDDVQEVFDSIRYNLEQEGFRGYRHEGGSNTGAAAHDVQIFWSPESDVRIQDARIADFAKAVDEYRAAQAPEDRTAPNAQAFHESRAASEAAKASEGAKAAGETKAPEAVPKVGARETSAPAGATPGPADAHLDAAIAALDPDMMVHMDGMPSAVRLADLMEQLRTEAKEQGRDSHLLEVAAQCALSFPAR